LPGPAGRDVAVAKLSPRNVDHGIVASAKRWGTIEAAASLQTAPTPCGCNLLIIQQVKEISEMIQTKVID